MAEVNAVERRVIRDRAEGRCEYCGIPEHLSFLPHQVDHIVALKHGGSSELNNLAWCCAVCNQHKGSDLASIDPETGEIALIFHPRKQVWADHFRLDSSRILGLTPAGRATVRLLQLNRPERRAERSTE